MAVSTSNRHLSGCYAHLACELDESLVGYVLRLAESNGYGSVSRFLRLLGLAGSAQLRRSLVILYSDRDKLERLGRIGSGDPSQLLRFHAAPLPAPVAQAEALYWEERRVDVDAVLPVRAPVCPRCLDESSYAKESWDLAPVTVCLEHQIRLIDACPACESPVTANRPSLFHCDECGFDLRKASGPSVEQAVVDVCADFAALAPFRVRGLAGYVFTADWEEMFHVFKVLLLPAACWAEDNFPPAFVASSSLDQRHPAIEALAAARDGSSYDMSRLRDIVERALAPMAGLPLPTALHDAAYRFLAITVGVSPEMANAITRDTEPPEVARAAELYSGRPPVVPTPDDVECFLGVNSVDVARLFNLGVIAQPMEFHLGYDADDLLAARRFLGSLLGVDRLSDLVGVQVRDSDLHPDGLLPRWNPSNRSDARVAPERAIELQRALVVRWHQATRPQAATSLQELAKSVQRPCAMVTGVVREILLRSIVEFDWVAPFSWADIRLPTDSIDSIRSMGEA